MGRRVLALLLVLLGALLLAPVLLTVLFEASAGLALMAGPWGAVGATLMGAVGLGLVWIGLRMLPWPWR